MKEIMRALLLILNGLGCGQPPDAGFPGGPAANSLGRIFAAQPALELPAFFALGLWKILTAEVFDPRSRGTIASFGRMRERSVGQDPTTGHWELAGVLLDQPFAAFEQFPPELIAAIERDAQVGFLGNCSRGGAAVLEEFGAEHLATGKPILYASAGSVLQIAAHERVVPRRRLHAICRIARRHADAWRIGRVIACPFVGEPGHFKPAEGRNEFGMVPPWTVLNAIAQTGLRVEGVAGINDVFAGSGITRATPAVSNAEVLAAIEALWADGSDGLIFADLSDFEMLDGARPDIAGCAQALVDCDRWLAGFLTQCEVEDLVVITAVHGNAPALRAGQSAREEVPLIVLHGGLSLPLGTRQTFADVAATLAEFFRLPRKWPVGESCIALQQRHGGTLFHRP